MTRAMFLGGLRPIDARGAVERLALPPQHLTSHGVIVGVCENTPAEPEAVLRGQTIRHVAAVLVILGTGCAAAVAPDDGRADADGGSADVGALDGASTDGTGFRDAVVKDRFETDAPDGAPDGGACIEVRDSTGSFRCCRTPCAGRLKQCGNCLDDDADGLIDAHDPDCFSPCHHAEFGALTEPTAGSLTCNLHCYYGPSASCDWDLQCDTLAPEPLCPNTPSPSVSARCDATLASTACAMSACGALTPNGCDCFGCCRLPGAGGYVYLGTHSINGGTASCTLDAASDPTRCRPCTPVPSCLNECTGCEICIGNVPAPGCFAGTDAGVTLPPGVVQSCPPNAQNPHPEPCAQRGQADCAEGFYCVTGCCQPVPAS